MGDTVVGTFTGEKISKIRWKPDGLFESVYYVSGSWDNKNAGNQLAIWHYAEDIADVRPIRIAAHLHQGDVTELQFLSDNTFVASSSFGAAKLFRLDRKTTGTSNALKVTEINNWNKLHYFNTGEISSCTGLACFDEDFVTIGEDGRIILLTAKRSTPTRVIDEADSCSLRCVCFLKHNSILTGNLRGQMKIWDLKSASTKAVSTFSLSGDHIGATCVAQHPSQNHVVLAGGEDGSLTVWDLRRNTLPVTLLSAHSDAVSEVKFHPDRPDNLCTCSASGEVWNWNSRSMARSSTLSSTSEGPIDENPWLSSDAAKHRLDVYTLMPRVHQPINSIDIDKNRIICGCDNEATYLIKNIATNVF